MTLIKLLVPALASALLVPSIAHADLGGQGTVAMVGQPRLELLHGTTTDPDGDSSSQTSIGVGLNAQYFVTQHLAVGGGMQALREWEDDITATTFVVQLVASYHVPVRPRLSVWPHVVVGAVRRTLDLSSDPEAVLVAATVHVPVVLELADHVFVGWGPIAATTIHSTIERNGYKEDGSESKLVGAQALFGVWF